ncbi:unnamed protein product [Cunninghamella blakesleeana]
MLRITLSPTIRSKCFFSPKGSGSQIQYQWISLKKENLTKNGIYQHKQKRWKHDQQPQEKTILTEHVYGRTRIYTSTIAKTKVGTASKTCISAPITSSTINWEWLNSDNTTTTGSPHETRKSYRRQSSMGDSFISGVKQNLRELFLPVGYPDALHPCYKKFHLWLGLETYVGSAIGVLCSQAMLASLGLGTVEATGGAVAIQWVLKDGLGELGKLFFIKRYASSFDSHPKTWKFVCELLSSLGSFLQLCTSIASPKLFLPLAALGNTFELIHESIWIASHMTFTKHFSPNGNIGDIVAKDDAQMSTAHLLGMLSGVGLISVSHSPLFLFSVFAVLSPINVWSTIKMINAAEFEILNQAKVTLLSREFIDHGDVINYDRLRKKEIGFGEWIRPGKSTGIHVNIKMGSSAEEAYGSSDEIQNVLHVLKNENYLLNYHNNTMHIMFHDDADGKDTLKSILHAMKFHDQLTAAQLLSKKNDQQQWYDYITTLDQTLDWTNKHFDSFVNALDKHNWVHDNVYWNDSCIRLSYGDEDRMTSNNESSINEKVSSSTAKH